MSAASDARLPLFPLFRPLALAAAAAAVAAVSASLYESESMCAPSAPALFQLPHTKGNLHTLAAVPPAPLPLLALYGDASWLEGSNTTKFSARIASTHRAAIRHTGARVQRKANNAAAAVRRREGARWATYAALGDEGSIAAEGSATSNPLNAASSSSSAGVKRETTGENGGKRACPRARGARMGKPEPAAVVRAGVARGSGANGRLGLHCSDADARDFAKQSSSEIVKAVSEHWKCRYCS